VSEPTIFGGLSGLHRSIKSRDDTEHGAREALARVIPGHRSVRFLGAEFDPTLDRVGGRRIRGCNSLALSAVDTTDANVAQVQASCLVPTVEIEFLVDSSPSIDYWKAKTRLGPPGPSRWHSSNCMKCALYAATILLVRCIVAGHAAHDSQIHVALVC
jgi:hypothetical protein